MIKKYFSHQINEILNDTALRYYGACAAFGHFLTFLYWKTKSHVYYLSNASEPVCWGFFENCFTYRIFSEAQVNDIVWIYGFLAGVGTLLFFSKRWVKAAYWFQIGMLLFKLLLIFWDYRMRMNQHYMHHFVLLAYLFVPQKRNNLQYLLVYFYVGAAFLKVNAEWMTGAVFNTNYMPMLIPASLLPAACVYVILLEFILIWGMLSKTKWIYWSTFFQLFMFHLVSWTVVGFYYPLLMGALLMIFPLTYFIPQENQNVSLLKSLFLWREKVSTYVLTGFFFGLQCIPFLIPGDSRITGEGRIFALHMYDARVVCDGAITLKYKDGTKVVSKIPRLAKPRLKCEPLVYFSRANWQCWKNRDNGQFDNLDFVYDSRLITQSEMRPLVNIKDFCGKNLRYNIFKANDWIIK